MRLYASQQPDVLVRVDPPRHPEQAEQVLREERDVEADEDEPEGDLPEPLVEHPAEDLRPPVEEPAEDRQHRAAEEHVVEVRDDVVGVVHLPVDGNAARKIPESPPIVNTLTKPSANSIGVSKWMFPRQSVASQLKIFTPVGHGDHHRRDHEEGVQDVGHPDREHVVRPDEHREEGDARGRERDRLVAEDRLAREDGDDLRDHPERPAGS